MWPKRAAGLGLTPLHLATLKGSAAAVAALLRAGAAPDAGTAGSPLGQHLTIGSTALHIAAAHGYAPCANLLLEFQAAVPGACRAPRLTLNPAFHCIGVEVRPGDPRQPAA